MAVFLCLKGYSVSVLFTRIGSHKMHIVKCGRFEQIINARYPKSECRKAIGEVVSKDSIAKYWDEIEITLNQ